MQCGCLLETGQDGQEPRELLIPMHGYITYCNDYDYIIVLFMLDLTQIQLTKPLLKHQLNNEGCKCQMCQKLVRHQTMRMVVQSFVDKESESYDGLNSKEYYIKIINKMLDWDKKSRKILFLLPEICVYDNSQPSQLISKKHENLGIKSVKEKSKMHMFEIIQFFLQGFVYHNPEPQKKNHRKKSTSFAVSNSTQKYKNECILIAKYKSNFHNMLTLAQMEGLFKSRQKYMRDGLMYLQTLVCTKDYNQTRINLVLRQLMNTEQFERAKKQIKMFYDELKSSDIEYVPEEEERHYERELKQKGMREYLQYLTLKIVLALSKNESTAISQAVFKYAHSNGHAYLVDVRVSKMQASQPFWANAAMKAYEYKLSRRMSMMDANSTIKSKYVEDKQNNRYLGIKARNLSDWLQKSTQIQWDQMKIIRSRLDRLEKEKKFLMQSQKQSLSMRDGQLNRTFKIRSVNKH